MDTTGIGEIAELGSDIVTLVQKVLDEREPVRHARIMNRLIEVLQKHCEANKTTPIKEVEASCAELPQLVQQQLIAVLIDRMGLTPVTAVQAKETALANPEVSSINQNKIETMEKTTDPNLSADELSLTGALGKLTVLLAIFFGKTNTFVEATLNGLTSVPNTQVVTLKNIIDQAFSILIAIATIIGFAPFIRLATICKYYYDDIASGGSVSLLQLIGALIQSRRPIKQAVAQAKEKATDPTLGADELSLATQIGALVKMISLYLGSLNGAADDKAQSFVNAFMEGVTEVDENQAVTLKNVVDGSFGVLTFLSNIINNTLLKLVVEAVNALYDDFAGEKTGLEDIWSALSAKKAIILKKLNAPVVVAAKATA